MVVLPAVGLLWVTEEGPAFTAIALAGGAFLLWMGLGMVLRPAGGFPSAPAAESPGGHYHPSGLCWGEWCSAPPIPSGAYGGSRWARRLWRRPSPETWVSSGYRLLPGAHLVRLLLVQPGVPGGGLGASGARRHGLQGADRGLRPVPMGHGGAVHRFGVGPAGLGAQLSQVVPDRGDGGDGGRLRAQHPFAQGNGDYASGPGVLHLFGLKAALGAYEQVDAT